MKTIEVKLYQFLELSEQAKQKAINSLSDINDCEFIYYDAEQTVKAFCNAFSVDTGRNSWLECNTSKIEDCILELTGLRLRKYILNNFSSTLFAKKYLKSGDVTEIKKPLHRMRETNEIKRGQNKCKFYYSYYSNIQKQAQNCNLTGVCYDEDMLKPLYDFLKLRKFDNTNLEDLFNSCFDSLRISIEKEAEYYQTEEAIIETIEANDYYFTEEGKLY